MNRPTTPPLPLANNPAPTPPDNAALLAELAALKARNAELEAARSAPLRLTCKVSEKRAVSLYGLRRMPITLYAKEWATIFEHKDAIEAFIVAHADQLSQGRES